MNEALLVLADISYQTPEASILRNIHWRIHGGERWAIVGPSGAGKSTMLRVGSGMLAPTHGSTRPAANLSRQSFVFQQPVLLRASVLKNLALPLELQGVDTSTRHKQALEMLSQLGLAGKADIPALHLSGGEQQRLALGRALITNPQLLWLDEPTASLDTASMRAIESELARLPQSLSLVLVTHDLKQAQRLCTHMAVMHKGELIAQGRISEVLAQTKNQQAAAFLAGDYLD